MLDSDAVLGNATLTFGAMDMRANVSLSIVNDDVLELEEQFGLALIISSRNKLIGVEKGTLFSATGKILNDDGKCMPSYSRIVIADKGKWYTNGHSTTSMNFQYMCLENHSKLHIR